MNACSCHPLHMFTPRVEIDKATGSTYPCVSGGLFYRATWRVVNLTSLFRLCLGHLERGGVLLALFAGPSYCFQDASLCRAAGSGAHPNRQEGFAIALQMWWQGQVLFGGCLCQYQGMALIAGGVAHAGDRCDSCHQPARWMSQLQVTMRGCLGGLLVSALKLALE